MHTRPLRRKSETTNHQQSKPHNFPFIYELIPQPCRGGCTWGYIPTNRCSLRHLFHRSRLSTTPSQHFHTVLILRPTTNPRIVKNFHPEKFGRKGKTHSLCQPKFGVMLEWLKRHAWKACIRQKRIGGSNPPPSATRKRKDILERWQSGRLRRS